jgi:hypothetical protein
VARGSRLRAGCAEARSTFVGEPGHPHVCECQASTCRWCRIVARCAGTGGGNRMLRDTGVQAYGSGTTTAANTEASNRYCSCKRSKRVFLIASDSVKLLRLIIPRSPRVGFTPLGSLPAFCFLPLVELPAVAGIHPGRPCVSPARHLTGVAASGLPGLSRGPEPIHTSLGLYCRWTRSEWQWFPVVLLRLGPPKKKGPGVSACRHAHTPGNRSGTHYVLQFYCSLKGH